MGRNTGAPTGVQAGIVTGLWRYPVKSMAGEAITSADLSWAGIAGDRRWAFLRPESAASGFPWHTIRENPAMSAYVPRLLEPGRPDKSAVDVRAPGGKTYRITDPGLADELGAGVRVMRLERGLFDAMPVSLITTSPCPPSAPWPGFRETNSGSGPTSSSPPPPGALHRGRMGRMLALHRRRGHPVDRRDSRCVIVDVNPGTGQPDAPVLKAAGRQRNACAGVYGSTIRPGLVRVGDPVTIAPQA